MGLWRFYNVSQAFDFVPLHDSVTITNQQPCQLATMTFQATDDVAIAGDEIAAYYAEDGVTEVTQFAGDVSVRTDTQWEGNTPYWGFSARDFTARLDDTIITANRLIAESAEDRVLWIMSQGESFGIGTSGVASIATTVEAHDYSGLSRRQALEQVAGIAQAVFYVNFAKELQFYEYTTTVAAPFDLALPPSPTTSYPFAEFTLDEDVTDKVDAIYVQGDDVAVWVPAEPTSGQKARALQASGTSSIADLTALGTRELLRIEDRQLSGKAVIYKPGIQSGMTVNFSQPALGVGTDFIINGVTTKPWRSQDDDIADYRDARYDLAFSDRLLCIPQIDTSRDNSTVKQDCSDCSRRVALLPSGMDSDLSLAEGASSMHAYDGTNLVRFDCGCNQVQYNSSVEGDLNVIYHEPIHEALLIGDRAVYGDPRVGAYGTARWSNASDTVTAAATMDIRRAWVVGNVPSDWVVTRGAGLPAIEVDGADLVFTSDNTGTNWVQMNTPAGGGAWTGADFDLLVSGLIFDTLALGQLMVSLGDSTGDAPAMYFNRGGSAGDPFIGVTGTSGFDEAVVTAVTATRYNIRWQHKPSLNYSRARIWAASGSEPGTWDVTRDPTGDDPPSSDDLIIFQDNQDAGDSIVQQVASLTINGTVYDNFTRTTTSPDVGGPSSDTSSVALQSRDMVDGSLIESVSLDEATTQIRSSPDGQHVYVLQGESSLEKYDRYLNLEATITLADFTGSDAGFASVELDWNVDNAGLIYRVWDDATLAAMTLFVYEPDGSEIGLTASNDLSTLSYRFPSLQTITGGTGQQLVTLSSGTLLVGYKGGADWEDGSTGLLVDLSSSTVRTVEFGAPDGIAQIEALTLSASGCWWMAGAAQDETFEGQAITGQRGWIMRTTPNGGTSTSVGISGSTGFTWEDV